MEEQEVRALRREGVLPWWGSIMGLAEGQVWWIEAEEARMEPEQQGRYDEAAPWGRPELWG